MHSLYLYLSTPLSLIVILKRTGTQSLHHIGGDRGPTETIDLAVCEYISEIYGVDICHTHRVDTNGNVVLVF